MLAGQLQGQGFRLNGVLTNEVIGQASVWLQRGAERQVRGEGVIDVSYTFVIGIIDNLFGNGDPAYVSINS